MALSKWVRFPKSEFLDTSDLEHNFNIAQNKIRGAAVEGILDSMEHLEQQAKDLGPLKDGRLTGDIAAKPYVEEDLLNITGEVHAGGGLSADYALRQHEELEPAPGATMQPGEITAGRSGNEVGPAGGKYLTRPLNYHMKRYMKHVRDKIKKALKS